VKVFAASYKLDKQRDGTLDDILHLCKQDLVLSSRWGTLGERCVGCSMLTLSASEEVSTRCCERAETPTTVALSHRDMGYHLYRRLGRETPGLALKHQPPHLIPV
jgi:hypothetical protein